MDEDKVDARSELGRQDLSSLRVVEASDTLQVAASKRVENSLKFQ